jgi:hypothetical protein
MIHERVSKIEELLGQLRSELSELEEDFSRLKEHNPHSCFDYAHEDLDYEAIIGKAEEL